MICMNRLGRQGQLGVFPGHDLVLRPAPLPEQPRVAQIAQTVNASAERLSSDRSALDGPDSASREVAAQVEALIAIETALRPK